MTSRERFLSALSHTPPDRVPIGLRFADDLAQRLKRHLGLHTDDELRDYAGIDLVTVRPTFRTPASDKYYADPTIEVTAAGLHLDIYRIPYRHVQTEFQSYMEPANQPPLANAQTIDDLDAFPWPRADDWDYSHIAAQLHTHRDRATWARSRGIFDLACLIRGTEQLMIDLMLTPEFASALLDRITDVLHTLTERTLAAGNGAYTFYEYNDDIASQRAMMISPALWRQFIQPRMAKICNTIHRFGARVRYHSCGSIYPIIRDLIDMGVDILNPIQPIAHDMDPFRLKHEFGQHLTFDGGIDIQQLLPTGTIPDVRHTVRRMIDIVGRSGGYILAGSHTLQGDIPLDNILALIDEAHRRP